MRKLFLITAIFALVALVLIRPWQSPPQNLALLKIGTVSQAFVNHLEALTITNPITAKPDPYSFYADKPRALVAPREGAVCAVKFQNRTRYSIHDYASAPAALADGAHVTHTGSCGTCSTLQDLAVYLRRPDLTAPVRRCGLLVSIKPLAMRCLENLGFTPACSETWYADARHTSQACWKICMQSWIAGTPPNAPDGSLNACLACDEMQSGPVFQHEAGRTRRNSGIISSIGRPSNEVSPIKHNY